METVGNHLLNSTFVQLIQLAIGRRDSLDHIPTEHDWKATMSIAARQCLTGVCCRGMMMLPAGYRPAVDIKVKMGFVADSILEKNRLQKELIRSLAQNLTDMGLECCLLKGQAVARLYPDPSTRNPGDIDMWVRGGYRHVLDTVAKRWKLGKVFYHHVDIEPFGSKNPVELHFTPSWMNDWFANRTLQRYFHYFENEQFGHDLSLSGCACTTIGFDCVFSSVHILRHLLSEGVGLRQVLDYCLILENSDFQDRTGAYRLMCSLGMKRFLGALMYVESMLFMLPLDKLLCEPDPRWGGFLMDEIAIAGNFGKYDPRFRYSAQYSLPRRAWARMWRLVHYFRLVPREVIWAPLFKSWQYCWRLWVRLRLI